MRTITLSIYTFDELSDKAKDKARDWMRDCSASVPYWPDEHHRSRQAALRAVQCLNDGDLEGWRGIIRQSRDWAWTGYCDDGVLAANADHSEIPSVDTVSLWYRKEWEDELEYQNKDEQIDESIRDNGFEFYSDGKIYR